MKDSTLSSFLLIIKKTKNSETNTCKWLAFSLVIDPVNEPVEFELSSNLSTLDYKYVVGFLHCRTILEKSLYDKCISFYMAFRKLPEK